MSIVIDSGAVFKTIKVTMNDDGATVKTSLDGTTELKADTTIVDNGTKDICVKLPYNTAMFAAKHTLALTTTATFKIAPTAVTDPTTLEVCIG